MLNEQHEALQSAQEYLFKLKKGVTDIYEFINNNEEKRAFNLISYVAEGIGWVIDVISLTKDAQNKEINIDDINEHIDAVVEGMENEDYMLVGDIFNYEILPILERVHKDINKNLN